MRKIIIIGNAGIVGVVDSIRDDNKINYSLDIFAHGKEYNEKESNEVIAKLRKDRPDLKFAVITFEEVKEEVKEKEKGKPNSKSNLADIKAWLTENAIAFDENAKKDDLLKLIV